MAKPFSKVRSAAIDGRVHNPFFRKTQLKRLHDKLIDNSAEIQKVLGEDTGHRPAEIKAEYWLALRCLADTYNSIEPERDLDAEYAIANGNDAPRACEPVGIVVIEPATHAFLFGLISALAPAIAAGNCVIIRVRSDHC
jgi:acyl-CoA reductase-like NAD-dependent aldehyde dehydrogenase